MPEGYFDMLLREAVRSVRFPADTTHNAAWDFLANPRMFRRLREYARSSDDGYVSDK